MPVVMSKFAQSGLFETLKVSVSPGSASVAVTVVTTVVISEERRVG